MVRVGLLLQPHGSRNGGHKRTIKFFVIRWYTVCWTSPSYAVLLFAFPPANRFVGITGKIECGGFNQTSVFQRPENPFGIVGCLFGKQHIDGLVASFAIEPPVVLQIIRGRTTREPSPTRHGNYPTRVGFGRCGGF